MKIYNNQQIFVMDMQTVPYIQVSFCIALHEWNYSKQLDNNAGKVSK